MKTYGELKEWVKDHHKEIVVGGCFVLVFLTGYGVGKFQSETASPKRVQQLHYTTSPEAQANTEVKGEAVKVTPTPVPSVSVAALDAKNCPIKGNISSKGSKIYHIKGGAFYDRTNPEQCFNTEDEARAAGFVKSSR